MLKLRIIAEYKVEKSQKKVAEKFSLHLSHVFRTINEYEKKEQLFKLRYHVENLYVMTMIYCILTRKLKRNY